MASTFIPFVTGSGAALRAARHGGDIRKAFNWVNKAANNFQYVYKYSGQLKRALKSGLTPVIGKMDDLNKLKLGKNEFKVADFIPNQGDELYNTLQNQAALDEIIKARRPVKDVSVDANGFFIAESNTGFLKMERDYLFKHGYEYDNITRMWYPK